MPIKKNIFLLCTLVTFAGIFVLYGCGDDRPSAKQLSFKAVSESEFTDTAPSGITAALASDSTGIDVTWNRVVDNKTDITKTFTIYFYDVLRNDGDVVRYADVTDDSEKLTVTDTNVSKGKTYYYRVRYVDKNENTSAYSAPSNNILFPYDVK